MSKTVKVTYNSDTLETTITVDGKAFDTTRINGKEIADWAYPFMMRKVRWNGFYNEMVEALGGEKEFNLVFEGSEADLNELKEAWEDAPVTVVSEESSENIVAIEYDENNLTTNITVNGKPFDTSRINGREIEDWVCPFMMRKIKWNGIFEELATVIDSEEYTIQFSGSNSAMKELMEECPETVQILKVKESKSMFLSASNNITNEEISETFDKMTSGVNPDYAAVLNYLILLTEQGYSEAQSLLGMMYQLGWGVNVDHNKAFDWHMKAAKQNHADSCCDVAQYYAHEELRIAPKIPKDLKKAEYWYIKSAEYGDESDKLDCAVFLKSIGKYKEAIKLFTELAEKGYAPAQNLLGDCYYNGEGVAKDYSKAVEWYTKAAEQGNAWSQKSLGYCYYNGEGIAQNYAEAVEWYTKAAEQGNEYAQDMLGDCYYNGEGVAQDYAEAVEWYTMAAEQGYAPAQNTLGICYLCGIGTYEDTEKAVHFFYKAAEQNYPDAYYCLGSCYEIGMGVDADIERAKAIYELGVKLGSKTCAESLAKMNSCSYNKSNNRPLFTKEQLKKGLKIGAKALGAVGSVTGNLLLSGIASGADSLISSIMDEDDI